MTRYARMLGWTIVLGAAFAYTAWSLYVVAHDRYDVPAVLAGFAGAVFDGAALLALDAWSSAAADPRQSTVRPRVVAVCLLATSIYLNVTHATWMHLGVPAAVLFAAPGIVLWAMAELRLGARHTAARHALGLGFEPRRAYGVDAWLVRRGRAWRAYTQHLDARLDQALPAAPVAPDVLLGRELGRIEGPRSTPSPDAYQAALAAECERRANRPPTQLAGPAGTKVDNMAALLAGGSHAPVVYFVQNGSRVKIGTSQNLRQRITALCLSPDDVLLVVHGNQKVERDLHRQFAHLRAGNTEWFDLTGELVKRIRRLGGKVPTFEPPVPDAPTMRDDDAPQADASFGLGQHPATKAAAVLAAVAALPAGASPEEINRLLLEQHGTAVDNAYIRTVLSREAKRKASAAPELPPAPEPQQGGPYL